MPTTSKGLRYPSSSAAPNVPQDIQNLASDVDGKLFTNGGTTGVMVGTAPPAGTPLVTKVWLGTLTFNAAGDNTVNFPGGAFPNGLLYASADPNQGGVSPSATFTLATWGASLSTINVKAFQQSNGAVAASTAIAFKLIAVGW